MVRSNQKRARTLIQVADMIREETKRSRSSRKYSAELKEIQAEVKRAHFLAQLEEGIVRKGDQWAGGKLTYRRLKASQPEEYDGRYLAVAKGGVDLVGEVGETKESFEQRVKELVKPWETYSPYIVLHAAAATGAGKKGAEADE